MLGRLVGTAAAAAAAGLSYRSAVAEAAGRERSTNEFSAERMKILPLAEDMLQRWEKDEEGWNKLPARAWPMPQPAEGEIPALTKRLKTLGCRQFNAQNTGNATNYPDRKKTKYGEAEEECFAAAFVLATAKIFNGVADSGEYRILADQGHPDAMVATGVCLLEGLACEADEEAGVAWLRKANKESISDDGTVHTQALFELGSCHYLGVVKDDGTVVMEEDDAAAFKMFEASAKMHTGPTTT